jgi:hypothetical protein
MLKQEFDEIAAELGYTPCDPNMYQNEIEPTYMHWGQDEMLTHEEMVRMYWGIEPWDWGTWTTLNSAWREMEAAKAAFDKVEETFKALGLKVPESISKGFQEEKNHLAAIVHARVTSWRERSKKAA